jgi:hypothetical protein
MVQVTEIVHHNPDVCAEGDVPDSKEPAGARS